jgi:hypothetical protein
MTLKVGDIVRFKGPSRLCPYAHPEGRGIGVIALIERNDITPEHDCFVVSASRAGWARTDELELIDEWGVTVEQEEVAVAPI